MKKTLLIPMALITGFAPVISLAGCNKPTPPEPSIQTFELDKFRTSGSVEFDFYRNNVDLSANTWYEAKIDTSAHASEMSGVKMWSLVVPIATFYESEFLNITQARVWIDGDDDDNELHQVPYKNPKDLNPDEFVISTTEIGLTPGVFGARNLSGKHTIKIQFQVEKNAIRADLVSILSTQL